jgi:hypothetical protein
MSPSVARSSVKLVGGDSNRSPLRGSRKRPGRDFTRLDTTIFASAEMLRLLAPDPALWQQIRADERLINAMVAESVRISSPTRGFTRRVTVDASIDGQPVQAGSRAALLFASANWDERQFADPFQIDLTRPANQQLGWGRSRPREWCLSRPPRDLGLDSMR